VCVRERERERERDVDKILIFTLTPLFSSSPFPLSRVAYFMSRLRSILKD
jgi:hypothetical protein